MARVLNPSPVKSLTKNALVREGCAGNAPVSAVTTVTQTSAADRSPDPHIVSA